MLDQIPAGQLTGATRRTVVRPTPARASCVPLRTPYRTRFRAYQGPASPQRITDAIASPCQHLRTTHRPTNNGTKERTYAFVRRPAARATAATAAERRPGLLPRIFSATSAHTAMGTASQSFPMWAKVSHVIWQES